MRYDPSHKERTRRKVLVETAAAVRRLGPDGIGVADLMAKAGLTHGGFYAHFKSKDQLIAESIATMFEDRRETAELRAPDKEPRKKLARFIDAYLSARHRDAVESGCPLPSLSADVTRLPAAARKSFAAGAEKLTAALTDVLRALDKPQPRLLASSALAEMVGALALSRALDSDISDQILKSSRESIKRRLLD